MVIYFEKNEINKFDNFIYPINNHIYFLKVNQISENLKIALFSFVNINDLKKGIDIIYYISNENRNDEKMLELQILQTGCININSKTTVDLKYYDEIIINETKLEEIYLNKYNNYI